MSMYGLVGNLGKHPRGKILKRYLAAESKSFFPEDNGVCFMFGNEYQQLSDDEKNKWQSWNNKSGRALVLIPPFEMSKQEIPVAWEIYTYKPGKNESHWKFIHVLEKEVYHAVQGHLQTAHTLGGKWKDSHWHTAYYQKHPHSGIFVVTCLPIWSLSLDEKEEEIQNWIAELYKLAGSPARSEKEIQTKQVLTPYHYSLMLHFLTDSFKSNENGISALMQSPILQMPKEKAEILLGELESQGLVLKGRLTEKGKTELFQSPYAIYASEVEGMRER